MNCPHCGKEISPSLAARALALITSEAKVQAARENGRKGGRPKKPYTVEELEQRGQEMVTNKLYGPPALDS